MRLRLRRTGLGLGLLGLLGAAALLGGMPSSSAEAALSGTTKMEIDGNTVVNDPAKGDWLSAAASYPELRDKSNSAPTEVCTLLDGTEADGVYPGLDLGDININTGPDVVESDIALDDDLCANLYQAWELFENTPALGDQVILYLGWTRPMANGEIDVLVPLLGPDSASQADDLVVSYGYDDNTQTTVIRVLDWVDGTWTPIATPAGTYEAVTTDGFETDPGSGAALTFGEVAINLTGLGIFPTDAPCVTYTTSYFMSRSGSTSSATLADFADVAPMTISNCEVTTPAPDLTITKTHAGNFTQGQTGAQYAIVVTNSGSASTSGSVTVTETLPTGLAATALGGTGWTCSISGPITCTRSDALAAAASHPNITLTVNVASNAPSSVINSASVSGGGETNTANNTSTDPTTVVTPPRNYQVQGYLSWKVGTTATIKTSLAVDATRISDTEAAGLLSPNCRVFFSANATPSVGPVCMTYNAATDEFQFNWRIPKETAAPATIQITTTVLNANGTTNATLSQQATLIPK